MDSNTSRLESASFPETTEMIDEVAIVLDGPPADLPGGTTGIGPDHRAPAFSRCGAVNAACAAGYGSQRRNAEL
jgi:hypothetical protein